MEITENPGERRRSRSSRRLRHEAKAQIFTQKAGSLEAIRQRLELRPSQICELLRVHPSAWIRWNRTGRVPPHIYQMLEWYLELQTLKGGNFEVKEMKVLNQPAAGGIVNDELQGPLWLKKAFIGTWIVQILLFLWLGLIWGHKTGGHLW